MVVQHNLTAMNSQRQLGITTGAQAKSTEKLSSGYKINRAADDAAGLSISEKMRRQIRGLTQASSNAEDGISSVQTAEGALNEVHDMLQRMDELATKAANGTQSEDDRQNIQDEIDQLLTEIDRVSETTKFNETYLLKGDENGATKSINMKGHDAGLNGELTKITDDKYTFKAGALSIGDQVKIGGTEYTIAEQSSVKAVMADGGKLYKADGTIDNTSYPSVQEALDANVYKSVKGKTDTTTSDATLTVTDGKVKLEAASADKTFYTVTDGKQGKVGVNEAINVKVKAGNELYSAGVKGAIGAGNILNPDGVYYKASATQTLTASANGANTVDSSMAGKQLIDTNTGDIYTLAAGDDLTTKLGSSWGTTDPGNTMTLASNYKVIEAATDTEMELSLSTTKTFTEIEGDAKATATDLEMAAGKEITKTDAYKLMGEELKVANQIGVDDPSSVSIDSDGKGNFTINTGTTKVARALSFNLHVGADADMNNKISVDIETMNTSYLGLKGLNVKDETGKAATYAIDSIEDAIKKVSEQRSALGAVQNRLEHTIKNVDNVVENTTAAESQIRDTDMAAEMVRYSNNNILAQAGQSMLAQANQSNQGVLSILG